MQKKINMEKNNRELIMSSYALYDLTPKGGNYVIKKFDIYKGQEEPEIDPKFEMQFRSQSAARLCMVHDFQLVPLMPMAGDPPEMIETYI